MRIVSGIYKHRIINAPNNNNLTRPTSDKTRESIFNVIQYYISGSKVLDLFAGSGAFGIESLSRNASNVTFIDNNEVAINTIKSNLDMLNIKNDFEIINEDYHIISKLNNKYDLVFFDPPYKLDCFDEILQLLDNIISSHAIIVYECDENHIIDINKYPKYKIKQYKYGIAYVNILFKIN